MELSAVVIDDVFSDKDLIFIQSNIDKQSSRSIWFDLTQEHTWKSLSHKLMKLANNYYDLNNVIGYEFWSQYNTRPAGGWHYDRDEILYYEKHIFKFPVCSIVYYPILYDLIGGQIQLEKDVIVPKINRAIIFKPGMFHYVHEFEGTRCSLIINPWTSNLGTVSE